MQGTAGVTPVLLAVRQLGAGGSERQAVEMAKALDRTQFSPHVACFRPGIRSAELEKAGIPILHLPLRSFRSWDVITAARTLRAYVRAHRIRLVHSFDYPTACFLAPAARLAGVDVILTSQRGHRNLNPRAMVWLQRFSDRIVDGVVVNCEAMRRHMTDEEGVPSKRVYLCYNGIATEEFPAGEHRSEQTVTIGSVCVLRPEKDLTTLVRAFGIVAEAKPHIQLRIVGPGPELASLERQALALNLGKRIQFKPQTDRVAEAMRALDIFVLPSISEAFSNSLMEAMCSGCAVVASNTGGNPELVQEGKTGLLFPPGDSVRLAAILDRLAGNPALRHALGDAARGFVETELSREKAAHRLGEIYSTSLRLKS